MNQAFVINNFLKNYKSKHKIVNDIIKETRKYSFLTHLINKKKITKKVKYVKVLSFLVDKVTDYLYDKGTYFQVIIDDYQTRWGNNTQTIIVNEDVIGKELEGILNDFDKFKKKLFLHNT